MSETEREFRLPFLEAHGEHPELGLGVDLLVPANSADRPACRAFLEGSYFEPFTHTAFTRILAHSARSTAVHAGTYFGDMLDTLSRCSQRVFAFEPVLASYYFAKQNAARLGLTNVILINAGLSNKTSVEPIQTTLDGRDIGGLASFNLSGSGADATTEFAPVFRLDDLPIDDLALIHLDVEGVELAALTGATALIEQYSPVIMIEDNTENCGPFLTGRGYARCFSVDSLGYWARPQDVAFVMSIDPTEKQPRQT